MAYEVTEFTDCMNVIKKFEKAAAYAVTEESVFAQMAPILQNARVQSKAVSEQMSQTLSLSNPQSTSNALSADSNIQAQSPNATGLSSSNIVGSEVPGADLRNLDKADENDEGWSGIGNAFFPGADGDPLAGFFDSKCIPCGFRINMLGELVFDSFVDLSKSTFSNYLEMIETWLGNILKQIRSLQNLFSGFDRFVDLCALLDFLNDFVCLPDLQRILSVLMALMSRTSFEFGGLLDFILQLVAPLLMPFLSGLLNMLQQYILMVVRPIECIIDSLQQLFARFDYNILFQNIDTLEKQAPIKRRVEDPRDPIKVPFFDAYIPRRDIVEGEGVLDDNIVSNTSRELFNQTLEPVQAQNRREQEAIEQAAEELAAVRKAARNVNGADPDAVAKAKAKERAAAEKYNQAIEEKNFSEIGQINNRIDEVQNDFKSSITNLISFLREAVNAIEGFFQDLFGEFKKLIGEYVGGSGGFIGELFKKMALVQIMGLISSLIAAFAGGIDCRGDDGRIRPDKIINQTQGLRVWTDEDGRINIEEDEAEVERAINNLVETLGTSADTPNAATADKGGASNEKPRQKLKSLIEFTGDPVLDTEIARATEQLVTPVSVSFKCDLQTSVSDAEQVNQWIRELNQ